CAREDYYGSRYFDYW
nr:immunoglobulin heavy chain junction region [Mus musculus]